MKTKITLILLAIGVMVNTLNLTLLNGRMAALDEAIIELQSQVSYK